MSDPAEAVLPYSSNTIGASLGVACRPRMYCATRPLSFWFA